MTGSGKRYLQSIAKLPSQVAIGALAKLRSPGISELIIGTIIASCMAWLIYTALTPEPRSVIGMSVQPNYDLLEPNSEPPFVRSTISLDESDIDFIVSVLDKFSGTLKLRVGCADFKLLEETSTLNRQRIQVEHQATGATLVTVEAVNQKPMVVFDDQLAEINFVCKNAMARTGLGKRSVTLALNIQHVLYDKATDFVPNGIEVEYVRTNYPWVRDRSIWTSEPKETNYGVDMTVYTVEEYDNYQFDIRRIDGSGASELVLIILSTLLGVGVTLITDGIRRSFES